VYSEAYEKGRVALLRFRAELISDFEALDEMYFYPPPPEPKYIYYLGESKSYEKWDAKVKERETGQKKLYNDSEEKMIERKLPYKEKDVDNESWWNYDYKNENGCNTQSNDDDGSESEEEDEDVNDKVKSLNNKVNQLLDEVKSLNNQWSDVKEEVKSLNSKVGQWSEVKNEVKSLNSKIDQLLRPMIK